jgi:hypothetical protein
LLSAAQFCSFRRSNKLRASPDCEQALAREIVFD